MDYKLVLMLEDGRENFSFIYGQVKIEITGENRCRPHNEEVQKKYVKNYVPFSSVAQHIISKGMDHKYYYKKDADWILVNPDEVYDYYESRYPDSTGIGKYYT